MTDALQHEAAADMTGEQYAETRLRPEQLSAALEALLFAAGDPLPLEKLASITGYERSELQRILSELAERYRQDSRRGLLLREIDGQYLLTTKPEQKSILQRLFQPRHRPPLSQAAYETLAIIAYNQPVTRAQVEAVRGVNSDSIISRLLERNLIIDAGTLDAPGRPVLFSTTDQFLLDFGLRSVDDLPPMEMLMYGTLRDFEESLEDAAGRRRDRQISIDQLVSAFVPDEQAGSDGSAIPENPAPDSDSIPENQLSAPEMLDVSEALFGHTQEEDA